jgi:hypothetical protein
MTIDKKIVKRIKNPACGGAGFFHDAFQPNGPGNAEIQPFA